MARSPQALILTLCCGLLGHQALGAESAAPYLIGPGDTITVTVFGAPELPAPVSVTVSPDGAVQFPWAGELTVGGKTRTQVSEAITRALGRRYRHLEVVVNVTQFRERVVFVLGEVAKAGAIPLQGDAIGLLQAIAAAGGLGPEASETGTRLYRLGQPAVTLDLGPVMSGTGPAVTLQAGDILVVEKRDQVTILGEVGNRGMLTLPQGARLSNLLALAGAPTERADPRRAIVVRDNGETTIVDLQYLVAHPESPMNIPVAGIRTFVMPPKADVVVAGEVKSPGTIAVSSDMRLLGAIVAAGGLTDSADPAKVTLVDRDSRVRVVDLGAVLAHPESEANVSIGDVSTILVGKDTRRYEVSFLGEITKALPVKDPLPLSAALSRIGGLTPRADPHNLRIVHETGGQEVVDVSALAGLTSPGAEVDTRAAAVLLRPGDLVIVPRRNARVVVLGAVGSPGVYDFEEGDQVIDVIGKAGGFADKAIKRRTAILRRQANAVEVISQDLKTGLRGSETLISGPLEDRDIIYVPKGAEPVWPQITSLLFGLDVIRRVLVP